MEIEQLYEFITSFDVSYVFGCAGTGKSTLIRGLLNNYANVNVISFTNNSVFILNNSGCNDGGGGGGVAKKSSSNIETIHTALSIFKTIEPVYYQEVDVSKINCCPLHDKVPLLDNCVLYSDLFKCSNPKFESDKFVGGILCVDECSLVSHELIHLIEKFNFKHLVYFGDVNQLQPVTSDSCNVCGKKCNFNIFKRTRKLLNNTKSVGGGGGSSSVIDVSTTRITSNVVTLLHNYRNSSNIVETISEYVNTSKLTIKSINYKEVFDMKHVAHPIICYKNSTVDYINKIFTECRAIPQAGDKIYFNSGSTTMIVGKIYTVEECWMDKLLDKTLGIIEVLVLKIDDTLVFNVTDTEKFSHDFIGILKAFDANALSNYGSHESIEFKRVRNALIFHYRSLLNPWSYAYAITAHKAQGSTYENAYLNLNDLFKSRKDCKRQVIYTALSRAKHEAFNVVIPSKWLLSSVNRI